MVWNLVGQGQAVAYLRRSLAQGALPHALLLVGPPRSGKETLAITLAQALNCPTEAPPCGACSTCRRIASFQHPDVMALRLDSSQQEGHEAGEKEISIEQVRTLQHSAGLLPFEGPYRVFVIVGAETLSHEAANALLKTLEEPGPHVVLILTAVNEEAVLPTVRSRCQRVPLRLAPVPAIAGLLEQDYGLTPDAALALARESGGRTGWAVSAAQDPAVAAAWRQGQAEVQRLMGEGLAGRFRWAAQEASDFGRHRAQVLEHLDLALDVWHDLLLLRAGCPADLVLAPEGRETLAEAARRLSIEDIRRALQAVRSARIQLEGNANPRLVLEVLALDLPILGTGRQAA